MPDIPVSQIESGTAAKDDEAYFQVVADGRADIAAGRILTPQSIDDWIAAVGTACERPLPQSTGA
jgi:predicted transcriptional regulator